MLAESRERTTGLVKDATVSTGRTADPTERTADPKDSSAAAAPPHPLVIARAAERNIPPSTLQDPPPASFLDHVSSSFTFAGRAGNLDVFAASYF